MMLLTFDSGIRGFSHSPGQGWGKIMELYRHIFEVKLHISRSNYMYVYKALSGDSEPCLTVH
jgi:hypothetical protein